MAKKTPIRNTRVFSISFPEKMARQVEALAKEESRTVSELFREAFRTLTLQRIHRELEAARADAAKLGPVPYTENDVEAIVDEIRTREYKRRKKTA